MYIYIYIYIYIYYIGSLSIRVPCYIGDAEKDPNLEKIPTQGPSDPPRLRCLDLQSCSNP